MLCFACICCILVLCINAAFSFIVVVSAGVSPLLHFLRDGARENLQELSRVRLPVEDCNLREELREENGVAQRPAPLIF